MKTMIAFIKKELVEQLRTSKVMLLGLIFILFGIMNPAIAKLTPWLLETMADSLAESGMIVTNVTVSAMDSWVQFFKNIPMALIAFILIESNIFTKEYQSGTLLLALTKGLERYKIVISKTAVLIGLWSFNFWMCFGITYGYNAYFWDNSVAKNLLFSVTCWWLFGVWVLALLVLFSTLVNANSGVLVGTGAVVLGLYLLGLVPKVKDYLPTLLMDGNALIYGISDIKDYTTALLVAGVMLLVSFFVGIILFNKKQL